MLLALTNLKMHNMKDKVYYIITSGGYQKKAKIEKLVFPAKDKMSEEDISDVINDISDCNSQQFIKTIVLKEKEFLTIKALNPEKIDLY